MNPWIGRIISKLFARINPHLESLSLEPGLHLHQGLLLDLLNGLLDGSLVTDGRPEHRECSVPDVIGQVGLHLLEVPANPRVDGVLVSPVVPRPPGGPTVLRHGVVWCGVVWGHYYSVVCGVVTTRLYCHSGPEKALGLII